MCVHTPRAQSRGWCKSWGRVGSVYPADRSIPYKKKNRRQTRGMKRRHTKPGKGPAKYGEPHSQWSWTRQCKHTENQWNEPMLARLPGTSSNDALMVPSVLFHRVLATQGNKRCQQILPVRASHSNASHISNRLKEIFNWFQLPCGY